MFLNPENPIFLHTSAFIPSCHCWRPLVASASSRRRATARTTRAQTATRSPRHNRAGKTTPCECGGLDRWAAPPRGAEIKAPPRRRPEAPAASELSQSQSGDVSLLNGHGPSRVRLGSAAQQVRKERDFDPSAKIKKSSSSVARRAEACFSVCFGNLLIP